MRTKFPKKEMTIQEFCREMRRLFGVNGLDFVCHIMLTYHIVRLDVVKFDKFLMKAYRYPDGTSMAQFIEEKFGKEARAFCEKTI